MVPQSVPVLTWLSCAMCGSPGRVLPCRKAILMPELYLVTAEHISCPRLVGRDKALDLFWTARTLKGKEAADMGLVTHCVPDTELDAFVEQYMEKLLAAPQQAMRLTNVQSYRVSRVLCAPPRSYLLFHGNRHRTRRLPSEDQRPRCENAAESAVKQPINKPENRKPITQEKAVPHGQLFLLYDDHRNRNCSCIPSSS